MGISSLALVMKVKTKKKKETNKKSQTRLMSFAFKCGTNVTAQTVPSRSRVLAHTGRRVRDSPLEQILDQIKFHECLLNETCISRNQEKVC